MSKAMYINFDKKWIGPHFGRFFSQTHLVTLDQGDKLVGLHSHVWLCLKNWAVYVCPLLTKNWASEP
jgi:hypothetical protein